MDSPLLVVSIVTILLVLISTFILRRSQTPRPDHIGLLSNLSEPSRLTQSLKSALPHSIVDSDDSTAFKQSMNSYWAQQECEVIPACVVRPRDTKELSTAIGILKGEFDEQGGLVGEETGHGLFAIRGGGHSPVPGAASISEGVLIDLGLFNEVILSEDRSSVIIGAGARWADVSRNLDAKGLAVVGGRNSAVGVGGLILGG